MKAGEGGRIPRLIKRQVHGALHQATIRYPHGLGDICLREIKSALATPFFPDNETIPHCSLTAQSVEIQQISFRELMALPFRLRTAKEILWQISENRCDHAALLARRLKSIDTALFWTQGDKIALRVRSTASRLFHEGRLTQQLASWLETEGLSPTERKSADFLCDVVLHDNRLRLCISAHHRPLNERGYRPILKGTAPIKEHLAAALMLQAIQGPDHTDLPWIPEHIWIPFAGSGTFGFEALMHFWKIPPRLFAPQLSWESLACSPEATFRFIKTKLNNSFNYLPINLTYIESDKEQAKNLVKNGKTFAQALSQHLPNHPPLDIDVINRDTFQTLPPSSPAQKYLLLLNPPYGHRLANKTTAAKLYRKLGQYTWSMAQNHNVRGVVLSASDECSSAFLQATTSIQTLNLKIKNGGIPINAHFFANCPV